MAKESKPSPPPDVPLPRLHVSGSGFVEDRTAKTGRIKIGLDVSPERFLTTSRVREEKVFVRIAPRPGDGKTIKPIEFKAKVRVSFVEVDEALVSPDRLGDLEDLIRDKTAMVDVAIWAKQGDLFPVKPDA